MTIHVLDGFELERTRSSFDQDGTDLGRYPLSTLIPVTFIAQEGRVGGSAFRTQINLVMRATNIPVASGTYQTGFGFRVEAVTNVNQVSLCIVRNEATAIALELLIRTDAVNGGFKLRLVRHGVDPGDDVEIIDLERGLDFNTWHYFEIRAELTATSNAVIFRINDDTVVNKINTGGSYVSGYAETRFRLRPVHWSATFVDIDDFYVSDGAEGFLGSKVQIVGLTPNKDGDTNNWITTPVTPDHFSLIDDANTGDIDRNLTRLDSIAQQDRELFFLTKMANAQGKVHAIRVALDATSIGAAEEITPLLVTSEVNTLANVTPPLDDYIHFGEISEVDPATERAWNIDQIENIQVGFEIP